MHARTHSLPDVHVPELRRRRATTSQIAARAASVRTRSRVPSELSVNYSAQIGRSAVTRCRSVLELWPSCQDTEDGFHIVSVDQSIPGTCPSRRARSGSPSAYWSVEERALRQYVRILAGQAEIGIRTLLQKVGFPCPINIIAKEGYALCLPEVPAGTSITSRSSFLATYRNMHKVCSFIFDRILYSSCLHGSR